MSSICSGVVKERIAQIVDGNSDAPDGPFVELNCGVIPAELVESELFGAKKAGAYTGALRARIGRFELANGGILSLDEISNMPLAGQVKLLRVLETELRNSMERAKFMAKNAIVGAA